MLLIPNKGVLVPKNEDIVLQRTEIKTSRPRQARENEFVLSGQTQIGLPYMPASAEWVEVYFQGQRIVNTKKATIPGGFLYKQYNVVGNIIYFDEPILGLVKVICDTVPTHDPLSTIIDIKNIQHDTNVRGLYCEPIILVPPKYGYARLTTDRQSIAYMPNRNFRGTDSLSYSSITQNGQIGAAQCAFIVVTQ